MANDYWNRKLLSRRTALRGAALGAGGAAALSFIGCGNDDASGPVSSGSKTGEAIDWAKGNPGGKFAVMQNNYPTDMDLIGSSGGNTRVAGLAYSGLLVFKAGKTGVDPTSLEVETDAAAALPEQPDQNTYVFKLRPGIKFHNGRAMTSQDVKYSLDTYAFGDKSIWRDAYSGWLDKVEATSPDTVTIKSKQPYADTLSVLAAYQHPYIHAKEFQEGPDVNQKLMGTGAYIFVSAQSPVTVTFRKNPEYFLKPYPYFDEVTFYVTTDDARRVADFASRQIHWTWINPPELTAQIKQARPDAQAFTHVSGGQQLIARVDQAPYNDKRVRQALNMTIDRKQIRDAIFEGLGEDDQTLSLVSTYWGVRKPSELKSAQYWKYDPTAAKQLLAAAGVTQPISGRLPYKAGATNQVIIDQATLMSARWKDLGITNYTAAPTANAVFNDTVLLGNFDGVAFDNNGIQPILGSHIRKVFWSPPEGVKSPTNNVGHVYNAQLNTLLDKQLTQFNFNERKGTFREIEELVGEEQYRPTVTTNPRTWFADPSVKNIDVFQWSYQGTAQFIKYWWFA